MALPGWWVPERARRQHYFKPDGTSLCREHVCAYPEAAEAEQFSYLSPCATCYRAHQAESGERCICVGTAWYCDHRGRCKERVAKGTSDNYCSDCLTNAQAESRT